MRLLNFRTPAATFGLALLIGTFVYPVFALPTNTAVAQQRDDSYAPVPSPTSGQRRKVKVCERYRGRDGRVYVRCYYR